MYHYVRDLPNTRYPRIKGLETRLFERQVSMLSTNHEMATLESSLAFLRGEYRPNRDMYLLTFDDGLKDHYTDVLPVLYEHGIQGVFFLPTSCVGDRRVAAVHKNHFLMAAMGFTSYRSAFLEHLQEVSPETDVSVDLNKVERTYRWDDPETASFKYLLNFRLSDSLRDQVLETLFSEVLGQERSFAGDLYISWDEAREMQASGMIMGGHSHLHIPLSRMDDESQRTDLAHCARLLHRELHPQSLWPFSYPYGKRDSFNDHTIKTIRELGFDCSFATEVGHNRVGHELYVLKRIDTKDVETSS